MISRNNSRLVYSSEAGRICPACGLAERTCRCKTQEPQALPSRLRATLRVEKKGRSGKTVTVIDGLPGDAGFVKALCQDLKRLCGTGGAVVDGTIELQGELRTRVREHLVTKEFVVKG